MYDTQIRINRRVFYPYNREFYTRRSARIYYIIIYLRRMAPHRIFLECVT